MRRSTIGTTVAEFLNYAVRVLAADTAPAAIPPIEQGNILSNLFNFPSSDLSPEGAHELVPTVYSCVSTLQASVASLPLVFYGPDKKPMARLPKNPAYLFSNANPEDTGYELIEQIVGDMLTAGTAYVFEDYERTKQPQSLWCLPPDRVKPIGDKSKRIVDHYDIEIVPGKKPISIPAFQILRFPLYSTRHAFTGLSPLGVAKLAYTTQHNASQWLAEFYKKGALISGFFSTEQGILPAEDDRIVRQLRMKYQGIKNALNPVMLPKGLKFERAGLTLAEMDLPGNGKLTRQDIYHVFRIPPVVMGQKEGGGLSDAGATTDLLLYWEGPVQSLTAKIAATINERFLMDLRHQAEFGPGITCAFDFSGVRVFQEVLLKMMESGSKAADHAVLSVNDVRRIGRQPLSPDPKHDKIVDKAAPAAVGGQPKDEPRDGADEADEADEAARVPKDGRPPTTVTALLAAHPTAANVESLRARNDVRLAQQERVMARGVKLLGQQVERRVVERLRRALGGEAAASEYVVDKDLPGGWHAAFDMNDLVQEAKEDRVLIARYMRSVLKASGQQELADLERKFAFDLRNLRVRRWLAERSSVCIRGTTRTLRRMVADTLREGVKRNETPNELVARVRELIRERYTEQANNIVRTECHSSYCYGAWEAWKQSGVVKGKQWITAGDELVRGNQPKDQFSHVEAEGLSVGLDELFDVSGEAMLFPGDHTHGASAGNTCMCRCVAVPLAEVPGGDESSENGNGRAAHITLGEVLSAAR